MSTTRDSSIFPNGLVLSLPPGKHAASSLYIKGSYIVKLAGPGAPKATDQEIQSHIFQYAKNHHHDHSPFIVNPVESILERVIVFPSPRDWIDGVKIPFRTNCQNLSCQISIYDPLITTTTFVIDWVPVSVQTREIEKIASNFCKIERVSQDQIRTKYFITTRTKIENIPHWLHINNLIKGEKIRTLRVTIAGRKPKCQYCATEEHQWYQCPSKQEVIKLRNKYDPTTKSNPSEVTSKTTTTKLKSQSKPSLKEPPAKTAKLSPSKPPSKEQFLAKAAKLSEKDQALKQLSKLTPKPKTRELTEYELPKLDQINTSLEQPQRSPEKESNSSTPRTPLKPPSPPPPNTFENWGLPRATPLPKPTPTPVRIRPYKDSNLEREARNKLRNTRIPTGAKTNEQLIIKYQKKILMYVEKLESNDREIQRTKVLVNDPCAWMEFRCSQADLKDVIAKKLNDTMEEARINASCIREAHDNLLKYTDEIFLPLQHFLVKNYALQDILQAT